MTSPITVETKQGLVYKKKKHPYGFKYIKMDDNTILGLFITTHKKWNVAP